MRQKRHMSLNIEGFLRHNKRKNLDGFFTDENGVPMSHGKATIMLHNAQIDGWKLIPCGDCEGFDHFGGGCPGHPVEETDPENQDKETP